MGEISALLLDSRNAEACRRSLELSGAADAEGLLWRFGRMTQAGMVEYFLVSARHPKAGQLRAEIRGRVDPLGLRC